MATPASVHAQLLPRGDNQIGFLEMLAVMLMVGTCGDLVAGSALVVFIDNDGVLGTLIKGGRKSPEQNLAAGRFWIWAARTNTAVYLARVESKANIADGPTRGACADLEALGAVRIDPCLPAWTDDVWSIPTVQ